MIVDIVARLKSLDSRTKKAYKNIFFSLFIKGGSIAASLAIIPLTLGILNDEKYGLWITITSIFTWLNFFDIGLGNGLRNRLSEAIGRKDLKLAKEYVSTTYVMIFLVSLSIFVLFLIANTFLNWQVILNISDDLVLEVESIIKFVCFFFSIRFVLRLIQTVLLANHQVALSNILDFLGNALILIFLGLKLYLGGADQSLFEIALIFLISPILILFIASLFFYTKDYAFLRPEFKSFKREHIKILLTLGSHFFIVQICALVLYQTSNFIISNQFGPGEVTPYNIIFRYFSVLSVVFNIIITPYWSAVTEAHVNNDYAWIRKSLRSVQLAFIAFLGLGIVMYYLSGFLIDIWVGDSVILSESLLVSVVVFVLITMWNNLYAYFLNGLNLVKIQLYFGILGAMVNIPLAIYLGKDLGVSGVIIANVIVNTPGALIYPFIIKKRLNE